MKDSSFPTSSRQGFTLVEVLVSSFLTLMVMGMLFTVLIGTIDAWEGGTSKLEAGGNTRAALDLLKSDLEGLVARQTQYNQEWLYSGPSHIDSDGDFQEVASTSSRPTNTMMAFFSPSLDRAPNQQGDIVALSYSVWYQDPISPDSNITPIFGLYKGMTTTEEAFNDVLGSPLLPKPGTPGFWWTSSANPLMYDSSGFLAPHVVHFTVTWLVRYPGQSNLTRLDESHIVRLSNILEVTGPNGDDGGKIEAAEISITTISEEGMDRFRFFEGTANQAGQLPQIIDEFGTTHTIRVPITY